MTILTVAGEVAKKVGIAVPSALVSATEREYVELLSVAKWVKDRILEIYDWQMLLTRATIDGDGTTTAFPVEGDFARFAKGSDLWSADNQTVLPKFRSINQWEEAQVKTIAPMYPSWLVFGGKINFNPAPADGDVVSYWYISNKIILSNDTVTKIADFANDGDTFPISEVLLRLGMIARWKELKDQDYGQAFADYEAVLNRLTTDDGGAEDISLGRPRIPGGVKIAYPWSLGT